MNDNPKDRGMPSGGPTIDPHPGEGLVQAELEIDASTEAVWRALTDAQELTRWFPLHARVRAGTGGFVWHSWTESGGSLLEIDVWEPGRRLSLKGKEGEWAGLTTDFHLEGRSGRTVLRVVSSGFGPDEDWEGLLGAFGLGWSFELDGLKHYLERHRGSNRLVACVSRHCSRPASDVWSTTVGAGRWLSLDPDRLRPGATCPAVSATGEPLTLVVRSVAAPKQLVAVVPEWNDSLLRIAIHGAEHGHLLWVWMSCYRVSPDQVAEVERRWQQSMDELHL